MRRGDWLKRIGQAILATGLLLLNCSLVYSQAPYVTLSGKLTGPNGLPAANDIVNFQPTQMFFLPGTNTTQPVDSIYGTGSPVSPCLISGQFYTDTSTTPGILWQCQYGVWVNLSGSISNNYVSKVLTSPQSMLGPLSANVNGICSVAVSGAVGDCTALGSTASCTNNHDAIQAAIDECYATGGSVYFPTNPLTSGQTVYFTATAINPKGVSMFGPPGAGGPSNYYPTASAVAVRGAPSQDVFDVPAVGSPGYVTPRPSYTVQDLAMIVDNSVDASAAFPTRRPGRVCRDVVSNGTPVITSAAECQFQPGDVGQEIDFDYGTGLASTTILSWQSLNQVTLLAGTPTNSNIHTYISVLNLPGSQNIGNCAFAYDDPSGAYVGLQPDKVIFHDAWVSNTLGPEINNNCGFFFQGGQAPYQMTWRDSFVGAEFPFVFVPAPLVAPNASLWTGIADYNKWDHVWISGKYPFLEYSGSFGNITDSQISSAVAGPHFLNAYGVSTNSHSWTLDLKEIEVDQASCVTGATGFRIAGLAHRITYLGAGFCPGGAVVQWDASESTVEYASMANVSTFNITGYQNTFNIPSGADRFNGTTINNSGQSNQWIGGGATNPYSAIQPNRPQFDPRGPSSFGAPSLSRGNIAFNRSAHFLATGANPYYFNADDLWLWPLDVGTGTTNGVTVVADANSETGTAILNAALGTTALIESQGANWTIGSQIPAGKFRVYFKIRAASTPNWYADVQAFYSAAWHSLGCNATFSSITSAYEVVSCDADATGLTGDTFRILLGGFSVNTVDTYVAWVGIRPWDTDAIANQLQVGAGAQTLYRCVGGTNDGLLVWQATTCTGAGGTTTSTLVTTP